MHNLTIARRMKKENVLTSNKRFRNFLTSITDVNNQLKLKKLCHIKIKYEYLKRIKYYKINLNNCQKNDLNQEHYSPTAFDMSPYCQIINLNILFFKLKLGLHHDF